MAHAGADDAPEEDGSWVAVSSETVNKWREEAWAQKSEQQELCAGVADMSVSECGTDADMSACSRRVAAPRGTRRRRRADARRARADTHESQALYP
jgi:hypothetical protein